MSDPDTFLTALYVAVDEMLAASPPVPHPGPRAGLWPSEVVTLALFSQWARFGSERDFYGYATAHLHAAFPKLPSRTQLNRLIRRAHSAIVQVSQTLAAWLGPAAYEILDGTGVPVRNRQRRGAGWLPDRVAIGRCARLGWFEGFRDPARSRRASPSRDHARLRCPSYRPPADCARTFPTRKEYPRYYCE